MGILLLALSTLLAGEAAGSNAGSAAAGRLPCVDRIDLRSIRPWDASPTPADEIKWRVEQLRASGALLVEGRRLEGREITLRAYEQRSFQPLWTNPAAVEGLERAVAAAATHGLRPEDYHAPLLSARQAAPGPAVPGSGTGSASCRAAELDLLRTDAFVRLSNHLRFGKAQPEGPSSGAGEDWRFGGPHGLDSLVSVISSGRVAEALADLPPRHFVYQGLVIALARLRAQAASGGWESIPGGPTMRRDSTDARVPALRRRLGVGPSPGTADDADTLRFDATLETAVKAFQHRHGLNEDGLVGASSRAALNVPVERRIQQIRVNLERARWVAHELPDTFVAVNVSGARVYVLERDSIVFETRVIVGTEYTRTPLFSAPMLYVDLNPTWTVPASIAGEVLAAVRRDPTYLEREGMRVLDASGREMDPAEIDFSRFTGDSFPYVFQQSPGLTNALGQIKLMFPNPHSVYLHDTPSRGLFAREDRLFSHGCIRVQDPLGLAEWVLGDPERWNRETLRQEIDRGLTRTLRLPRPIPVYVLYWTASVDLHGELHFYRDVYLRDGTILAALDGPAPG